MNSSRTHLAQLDYFRGVAILGVLLAHSVGHAYLIPQLPWNGWLRDFTTSAPTWAYVMFGSSGAAGVAMFFVVSGFCIQLSFHSQGGQWGSFFTRRFFRIYPAYLAALVFSILVIGMYSKLDFFNSTNWLHWLTHLLLVHNFSAETVMSINGPFWSLAVEAQLYLLFPFLVYIVGRTSWRHALFFLGGCELLIRGGDAITQCFQGTNSVTDQAVWLFSNSPLGYWFSWSLGAYIADAFLNKRPLPFLNIHPLVWFSLAMTAYFFRPLISFQFVLFALMTASLLTRVLNTSGLPSKPRLPLWAVIQKIGLWSYSIYLIHEPVLNTFVLVGNLAVPPEYRQGLVPFLMVLVNWTPVLLISFLWHEFIEVPPIALGKRLCNKLESYRSEKPSTSGEPLKLSFVAKHRALLFGFFIFLLAGTLLIGAKLTPLSPEACNNLAWSLATSSDAKSRDGIRAVKLAEDACQRTSYQKTMLVGTLAAAYAEAGRFNEAVSTAQTACALAVTHGETNLLSRNKELLELYQNHQPYHELAR
jgi:peptidoglycan/LPS O-acetylase OafA/YrhL